MLIKESVIRQAVYKFKRFIEDVAYSDNYKAKLEEYILRLQVELYELKEQENKKSNYKDNSAEGAVRKVDG